MNNERICSRCNVDTREIGEEFMVLDDIWSETIYYFNQSAQFLCIDCVEYIIDRRLTPRDFILCPLNYRLEQYRSKKLVNRLTSFDGD